MAMEHGHTAEEITRRLSEERSANYVRDWVYGGIDGAITTFAIVAGVVGAALSSKIIIILGLANLAMKSKAAFHPTQTNYIPCSYLLNLQVGFSPPFPGNLHSSFHLFLVT